MPDLPVLYAWKLFANRNHADHAWSESIEPTRSASWECIDSSVAFLAASAASRS